MNADSSLLIEFLIILGPCLTLYQLSLNDMWLVGRRFIFIIKLLEMMEHCMTLACK